MYQLEFSFQILDPAQISHYIIWPSENLTCHWVTDSGWVDDIIVNLSNAQTMAQTMAQTNAQTDAIFQYREGIVCMLHKTFYRHLKVSHEILDQFDLLWFKTNISVRTNLLHVIINSRYRVWRYER